MTRRRIAVIGAGWAGLSAADRLSSAHAVTVYEAAPDVGGRARAFDWQSASTGRHRLDNGQHIMIGAYTETLRLIERAAVSASLLHLPLTLRDSRGLSLRAAPLPAPLHLLWAMLCARGLSGADKLAMAGLMTRARRSAYRLTRDLAVLDWLRAEGQPPGLIARLWAPLCVAALNTPAAIASSQIFLNVLRDSLGAARHASDLVLPLATLDQVLPYPLRDQLLARGATLHLHCPVRSLQCRADTVEIETRDRREEFDAVVLAVPAHQVAELLRAHAHEAAIAKLIGLCQAFTWQPITTSYLVYDTPVTLSAPMLALAEDASRGRFGQWVFARGALGARADTLAVVISADGPHRALAHSALQEALATQLRDELGLTARLLDARTVTEKRATFAAVPGLVRPAAETVYPHLVLAGDYTDSDYPATLEAATQSGRRAADLLLARL